MKERKIDVRVRGSRAVDGAGVSLVRVLGLNTARNFDPILMLDSFDSTNPDDYTAGFPMHPHRGIETISYVSRGFMKHSDSLGFSDTVGDGEVQWMTAGSGIMHEEQVPAAERLLGVQLWLNLPKKDKMTEPKYRAVKNEEIQEIPVPGGKVRLLAGDYTDGDGKVYHGAQGGYTPIDYYDVHLERGQSLTIPVSANRFAMAFTLLGDAVIAGEDVAEKTAVKLVDGDQVTVTAKDAPVQVLFISSVPLNEPIAWGGPVVMNTQEELAEAFNEMRRGTFVKHSLAVD